MRLVCFVKSPARLAIILAMTAALPGRGSEAASSPTSASVYQVRGIVRSVDQEHRQATIAHEAIAGYMPAMTMDFEIRDGVALPGLHPGDHLSFKLWVTPTSAWIDDLHQIAEAAAPPLFAPAPAASGRQLDVGDLVPDMELHDPSGKSIHLSDFHGQALAITFIYTRCPLPTYCPLMNRNFQAAQAILTRLEVGAAWHFFSLTLDAVHDTPAVLASFSSAFDADPQHWSFGVAPEGKVREFGRSVGLEFDTSAGQISHNLRTVVVDADGRITQIYRGNNWTPQDLAATVRAAMPRH